MSKYISIFCLALVASVILFSLFAGVFDGGDYAETAIYTIGTIIIVLLSFLISLMYYLINLLQRKI
ncbi:hypothetical protein MKX53_10080 [Psychrobacillus sp. FSL K6-4615]|uniref:hypothetical protein n=1 Tax=Psychrobacillus sp. FSL K6-4615 TaxID=2921551 RepID=UPI0030F8695E